MPNNGVFNAEISNRHVRNTLYGTLGEILFTNNDLLEFEDVSYVSPNRDYTPDKKSVSKGEIIYLSINIYDDLHRIPYQINTNFTEYSFTDNLEPNNSQQEATSIEVNGLINATVGYNNDNADWYSLKPTSNGIFKFKIYNLNQYITTYGHLGTVKLYDSNLVKIKEISEGYLDDGESRESTPIELEGGQQYYLFIEPENSNHAVPYKVELTFQKS